MNHQFIQGLKIDWNKIDKNSYLRTIHAITGVEEIKFDKLVTFLSVKMGAENQLC